MRLSNSPQKHTLCLVLKKHPKHKLTCAAPTQHKVRHYSVSLYPNHRVTNTLRSWTQRYKKLPQVPSMHRALQCPQDTIRVTLCPLFVDPNQQHDYEHLSHAVGPTETATKNSRCSWPLVSQRRRSQRGISQAIHPWYNAAANLTTPRQLTMGTMQMVDPRRNHSNMGTIETIPEQYAIK